MRLALGGEIEAEELVVLTGGLGEGRGEGTGGGGKGGGSLYSVGVTR